MLVGLANYNVKHKIFNDTVDDGDVTNIVDKFNYCYLTKRDGHLQNDQAKPYHLKLTIGFTHIKLNLITIRSSIINKDTDSYQLSGKAC